MGKQNQQILSHYLPLRSISSISISLTKFKKFHYFSRILPTFHFFLWKIDQGNGRVNNYLFISIDLLFSSIGTNGKQHCPTISSRCFPPRICYLRNCVTVLSEICMQSFHHFRPLNMKATNYETKARFLADSRKSKKFNSR